MHRFKSNPLRMNWSKVALRLLNFAKVKKKTNGKQLHICLTHRRNVIKNFLFRPIITGDIL